MNFEDILRAHNLSMKMPEFQTALTHPSYKQVDPTCESYERMETLGDAVLDLLVTKHLIANYPNISSGELTQRRAHLVSNSSLFLLGKSLNISQLVRKTSSYTLQSSDIADIVEAIFGVLYYHHGYETCQQIFQSVIEVMQSNLLHQPSLSENPVGDLQEMLQAHECPIPVYSLISEEGLPHNKTFTMTATIIFKNQEYRATASGNSKKEAKTKVASQLLQAIN